MGTNSVLVLCTLYYFQYFLQSVLELLLIVFIHSGTKMHHILNLMLALKQQFTKLINGKSQTN